MKGLHQQSSLLSALTKHNIVANDIVDKISADFIRQKNLLSAILLKIKM